MFASLFFYLNPIH